MPPTQKDARKALLSLEDAVNTELIGREREVHAIVLALIARMHLLLLSTPGTAKTFTASRVLKRIADASVFDICLQRDTKTDELVGPLDLPGLEAGHWRRLPDGFLPTAHFAVLDECFKGNSGVLNAMLWALNERQWRNDGGVHPIPLRVALLASNELPGKDQEELAPFVDRIQMRLVVEPLTDRGDLMRLLELPEPDPNPPTEVTVAQLDQAADEAAGLLLTDDAKDALLTIRQDVIRSGIAVSDRRLRWTMRIARAAAWYDGATEVSVEHLEPLAHCLWDKPDQITPVDRIVTKVAAPHKAEIDALIDAVVELIDQAQQPMKDVKLTGDENSGARDAATQALMEIRRTLFRAGSDYLALEAKGLAGSAALKLAEARRRMEAFYVELSEAGWETYTTGDAFWVEHKNFVERNR